MLLSIAKREIADATWTSLHLSSKSSMVFSRSFSTVTSELSSISDYEIALQLEGIICSNVHCIAFFTRKNHTKFLVAGTRGVRGACIQ